MMERVLFWGVPALYTLFLWWFSSGLIMALYGHSRRALQWGFAAGTLLFVMSLIGLVWTRHQTDPLSIYLAFTCGVFAWGWVLATYYFGFVTGPKYTHVDANNQPLGVRERFVQALRVCLYHELFALAFVLFMVGLTWSSPNQWGLWIILALWIMHTSGKLNVFLGVRNFHIEFLPPHLRFLETLLTKQNVNAFFPFSVIGASAVALFFFYQGLSFDPSSTEGTGYLLVGFMISLGVLEHMLLVLPLPVTLLGWVVRPLPQAEAAEAEIS
jgi:putative photosynthetic complex assembly protein 2